jgi:hypothetical protein
LNLSLCPLRSAPALSARDLITTFLPTQATPEAAQSVIGFPQALVRYGDLAHLEDYVAAMADNLARMKT